MHIPRREARGMLIVLAAFVLGALLLAVGIGAAVQSHNARDTAGVASAEPATPASSTPAASGSGVSASQWVKDDSALPIEEDATRPPTVAAVGIPPGAPTPASPAPKATTATPQQVATPAGSLDAYRGLGSWVDIYDTRAWADPAATVANMAQRGVRTIYIETANYHAPAAVFKPDAMRTFIAQAHARKMRVVAWYLPDLKANSVDFSRVSQAIAFSTADGQKFDSFALDIEATVVGSESQRNRNLATLSQRIRGVVGKSYALGAIIPSPVGLSKKASYWNNFPYTMLAANYDVFVPMAYYTYHGKGSAAAYKDATSNVKILRAQKGCSATPIHLIGGIAENSSAGEVQAFVRAERATGCYGASFYGYGGTTAAQWQQLRSVAQ